MDKAYDAVGQKAVDAVFIAKNSNRFLADRFRYQCLCCGEEVYLAAADSTHRSPHFRHRRGNNDTECEQYLGHPGAIEHFVFMRKHKQEHINFYFNKDRMTFEICVLFSEEEFQDYEKENSRLTVSSKYNMEPFLSVPINKGAFVPGRKNYFTIAEFSTSYFISFDSGMNRCTYQDVMRTLDKINIFRVKKEDEHCKCQILSILFTETEYIGISENKGILDELALLENVDSEKLFSFVLENRELYVLQFNVKMADYSVQHFFQKNDYRIETSEIFSVLWPPVWVEDSCTKCDGDTVYVHSSFDLIPYGNINGGCTSVKKISRNVSKVCISDEVIIYEKNIDVCIQQEKDSRTETIPEEPVIIYSDIYNVSDRYEYYLFDQYGCTRLAIGSRVYLSETDRIAGYENGHIKIFVFACPKEKMDITQFISDILKYHPQSESFEPDDFMNITEDETVVSYLESCYRSGRINTVVKRYIKEGLI